MTLLQQKGCSRSRLKELPWVEMAETVAKHVCTQNRKLFASCSMSLPELSEYSWRRRANNNSVDGVMGWQGRCDPKALCEACRPGAWLADFIHTLMAIEKGDVQSKASY